MVIKVYISGMSGNKEVKKRQQRVTMIMESKHIEYTVIDITEPGQEAEKDFMQTNAQHKGCTISDPNPRHALPPQLFNDTEYCGDYDDFDMANEVDNLEVFLKLAAPAPEPEHKNGDESAPATATAAEDEDENKENKTEDNGAAGDGAEATEDANEQQATKAPPEETGEELQSSKEVPEEEVIAKMDEITDHLKDEEAEQLKEEEITETLAEVAEAGELEANVEKAERTETVSKELPNEDSELEVENDTPNQQENNAKDLVESTKEFESPPTIEDNTNDQSVTQNDDDPKASVDTSVTEEQTIVMEHETDDEEATDDSVEDPEVKTVEETNVDENRKEECEIPKNEGEMSTEEDIVKEAVHEESANSIVHSEEDQSVPNNQKEDNVEKMEVEQEILTDEEESSDSDSEGDSQIENLPVKARTNTKTDVAEEESLEAGSTQESRSIGEVEELARMEADGDLDAEEQELRRASAALAGKSEDAEEQIGMDEVEEEEEDEVDNALEAAKEDEISSKLVDTDDPMMAEQEQEE